MPTSVTALEINSKSINQTIGDRLVAQSIPSIF